MNTLDLYIFSFFHMWNFFFSTVELFSNAALSTFSFQLVWPSCPIYPVPWLTFCYFFSLFVIIALVILIMGPLCCVLICRYVLHIISVVHQCQFCSVLSLLRTFIYFFMYRLKCQSYILPHPGEFFHLSLFHRDCIFMPLIKDVKQFLYVFTDS